MNGKQVGMLLSIISAFIVGVIIIKVIYIGVDHVIKVEHSRTDFAVACARKHGYTVRLDAASVEVSCVGPDGRVTATY